MPAPGAAPRHRVRPLLLAGLLGAALAAWTAYDLLGPPAAIEKYARLEAHANRSTKQLIQLRALVEPPARLTEATHAWRRLFDQQRTLNLENAYMKHYVYSWPGELAAAAEPAANASNCHRELEWILAKLGAHPNNYSLLAGGLGDELTQFMDSFGRPDAGTFGGSVNWFGAYVQCQRTRLDGGRLGLRYCVAKMRPVWWPRVARAGPPEGPLPEQVQPYVRLGVCLPESCETRSVRPGGASGPLIERLARWQLPHLLQEGLRLEGLYCLPDERSPIRRLPASGRALLAALAGWLALVVAFSVLYEAVYYPRKRQIRRTGAGAGAGAATWPAKLARSLALREAIKSLRRNEFRVRYRHGQRPRINPAGLDCIKCTMTVMVIFMHVATNGASHGRQAAIKIAVSAHRLVYLLPGFTQLVNSFYLCSAGLLGLLMLRKFSARRLIEPKIWLTINALTLAKVAPLYLIFELFARSVRPYLNAGPWWDYATDDLSPNGLCKNDTWWRLVPYLGTAFQPGYPLCNTPAWYIVDYLHLMWLLPVFLYLMGELPGGYRGRFAFVGALNVISNVVIARPLANLRYVDPSAVSYAGYLLATLVPWSDYHIRTLCRVGSVAVGCLLAHIMHDYETVALSRLPAWLANKWLLAATMVAQALIFVLPFVGRLLYERTGHLITAHELVLGHLVTLTLWCFLFGLLLAAFCTQYHHKVIGRFCAHSFWRSCAKLGLPMFFAHWEVIQCQLGANSMPNEFHTWTTYVPFVSYTLLTTFVVSLLLYLCLIAPIDSLLYHFLGATLSDKHLIARPQPATLSAKPRLQLSAAAAAAPNGFNA